MTRNNLSGQLHWLLRAKPSEPPEITLPSASLATLSPARTDQHTSSRDCHTLGTVQAETGPPGAAEIARTTSTGLGDGGDMARLRTAPGSAGRVNQVSMSPPAAMQLFESMPSIAARLQRSPSRAPASNVAVKQTPGRPLPTPVRIPKGLEIMDLTGSVSSSDSGIDHTATGARSSRKRKSEEMDQSASLEPGLQRAQNHGAEQLAPVRQPSYSEDFANLDELLAEDSCRGGHHVLPAIRW